MDYYNKIKVLDMKKYCMILKVLMHMDNYNNLLRTGLRYSWPTGCTHLANYTACYGGYFSLATDRRDGLVANKNIK